MKNENAIEVSGLTKKYSIYSSGLTRTMGTLGFSVNHKDFYALKDFSYNFKAGEVTAILGRNGSGKSTLLKLITGVANPDSGTIVRNGTVSAMLEVKSGFNRELTGLENIHYKALTMGIPKEEIGKIVDEVIQFADIGVHINQPYRTYSSGMKARLGFAVAVNVDPDILIVDEALSVGDEIFKMKCIAKMTEFREMGKTILFVSHSLATVKAFCTKGIWINKGKLMAEGEMGDVVVQYAEFLKKERGKSRLEAEEASGEDVILGRKDIVAGRKAHFIDEKGEPVDDVSFRDRWGLSFEYTVKQPVKCLTVAFTITNSEGIEVYACDKQLHELDNSLGEHTAQIMFEEMHLIPGTYHFTAELWDIASSLRVGMTNARPIMVTQSEYVGTGIVYLPHKAGNVNEEGVLEPRVSVTTSDSGSLSGESEAFAAEGE